MFCSNCGTQLPEGARVCPNCGADVPTVVHRRRRPQTIQLPQEDETPVAPVRQASEAPSDDFRERATRFRDTTTSAIRDAIPEDMPDRLRAGAARAKDTAASAASAIRDAIPDDMSDRLRAGAARARETAFSAASAIRDAIPDDMSDRLKAGAAKAKSAVAAQRKSAPGAAVEKPVLAVCVVLAIMQMLFIHLWNNGKSIIISAMWYNEPFSIAGVLSAESGSEGPLITAIAVGLAALGIVFALLPIVLRNVALLRSFLLLKICAILDLLLYGIVIFSVQYASHQTAASYGSLAGISLKFSFWLTGALCVGTIVLAFVGAGKWKANR